MATLLRTSSFFEQWAAEVLRQPALIFMLIVAPFLLLLAFGEGVQLGGPRPRTLIVQPPDARYPIEPLLQDLEQEVRIVGVTESLPLARRSLQRGDVDAVAVMPPDPQATLEGGQRIPIQVLMGEIDPVRRSYARSHLRDQVAALNQRVIAAALTQVKGQVEVLDGAGAIPDVDPAVLSAPFELQMEDVTPVTPGFTSFYSPGVLSLLVSHLAITLAALTLSRVRVLRVIDILRVAPVTTIEVVAGNYLSYAALCSITAAGLVAMLVFGLDVSVIGSYAWVAAVLFLLILSSLGIGFLASQLSSGVQQAVQVAMLVLLAAVFFSGFAFSIDRIQWPVRAVSYLLPVTYAIHALQDVMLRGFEPRQLDLGALAGSAAALVVVNIFLLRRSMRASR